MNTAEPADAVEMQSASSTYSGSNLHNIKTFGYNCFSTLKIYFFFFGPSKETAGEREEE